MTSQRKPPRLASVTFGKGSAEKQQARKNAHHQPFRDKLAALKKTHDLDAEVDDALARALARIREGDDA